MLSITPKQESAQGFVRAPSPLLGQVANGNMSPIQRKRASSFKKPKKAKDNFLEDDMRPRTYSMPTRNILKKPNLLRTHLGLHLESDEEAYPVRTFKINSKGIIVERSDSLISRSTNSVLSLEGEFIALSPSSRTSSSMSRDSIRTSPGSRTHSMCLPARVLVMGPSGVGKTALTQQFMTSEYLGGFDTSIGFCNWKDATTKFRKHESSDSHREAVERHITLPRQTRDIGDTLSAAHSLEKKENRRQLLTILRSIRFLARQGLPLRGHDHQQSNLLQVLKLQGESDESILKWLERKTDKYTCGDVQNEMLQVMALGILRDIASNIQKNGFFTLMADETTDESNIEQVVIVLRHVNSDLAVHEEFIGMYAVNSIDSKTLTPVIRDTLLSQIIIVINMCVSGIKP